MSNPDKSGDRSMSDILASIRKIMAQEPSDGSPANGKDTANGAPTDRRRDGMDAARPAALEPKLPELKLPQPKPNEAANPAPTRSAAPASPSTTPSTVTAEEPVSLDEFLATASPQKLSPAPAAPAKPAAAESKSGPMSGPIPAASQQAAATPQSAPAVTAPSPANATPDWLFPRPRQPDSPVSQAGKINGAPSAPAEKSPGANQSSAQRSLGDLGSVVPGRLEGPSRRSTEPATPEFGRPATSAPALGAPLTTPALGETPRPTSDPSAEIPGADALRRLIAGVIPPSAHPTLSAPPKPDDGSSQGAAAAAKPKPPQEPVAATKTASAQSAPIPTKVDAIPPQSSAAPSTAAPPTATPKPAVPAPASTPAATATPVAAPAPKPATPAPAASATAAPARPAMSAPAPASVQAAPVAQVPASAAKPQPSAPASAIPTAAAPGKPATTAPTTSAPASAPAPTPKPAAPAAAASPPAARTIDETVVELLRPLLRDWLEQNMPRLIEPALKAELEAMRAEAAKKPKT